MSTKELTPNLDKDIEKQSLLDKEMAELNSIEIGLIPEQILILAARERFNLASQYQILSYRSNTLKGVIATQEALGESKETVQYKTQLDAVQKEIMFILRNIMDIDRACPGAKAKMIALQAKN
jgi:hypothetical protein